MVQYNMILHTSLQKLRQNINQRLNSQKISHTSPFGWVMRCLYEYFAENWLRYNGTALYFSSLNMLQSISISPATHHHVDGLVPERRNSSALAMELRFSCTSPSNCVDSTYQGDPYTLTPQTDVSASSKYVQFVSNSRTCVTLCSLKAKHSN